ncbi:MAG TPA: PaaI family thioesterase [Baekduia sp.]|nr:PaaI family thioesterase [Baekduia sp.]
MSATVMAPPDLRAFPREQWADVLTEHYRSGLPGFLGLEILDVEPGRIAGRVALRDALMQTAGGILHAGTVVAFADSFAGWGCMASLPDGATGFVTSELKVNLIASTRAPDALTCTAQMLHGGRTTQVWDVAVARESDARVLAHFRCTQFLLS